MVQYFLSSEIFRGSSYGSGHPLDIPRVWPVMDLARHFGWLCDDQYLSVPPASEDELSLFHTKAYISALRDAEAEQTLSEARKVRHNIGQSGNPIYPDIYGRPATAAKASIIGAEMLACGKATRIFNPSGGTHHGQSDRAFGFCFVNDPVLGILTLLKNGAKRIAYIDIDAHHGDGVQDALSHLSELRIFSVHEADRWPRTGKKEDQGAGFASNYPLPRGAGDKELLTIIVNDIAKALKSFKPEVIVLQAGADGLADDPQSGLLYSANGYWRAVEHILKFGAPTLVLGGGGYNPVTTARAWTGAWGLINNFDPYGKLLDNWSSALLRGLHFPHRLGRNMPNRWFTHLADED